MAALLVLRVTTSKNITYLGPYRTRVEAAVAKTDLEYRTSKAMTIRVMPLPFYAKLTSARVRR